MENSTLKYDIVIIGGGTSGCAGAFIASKLGLKTLLVEKNNYLGGLMTGGLVVPVMKSSVENINCEYYFALVESCKKFSAQITYKDGNDGWFNPEVLKIAIEDLLTQPEIKKNLDILFETSIDTVIKNDNVIEKIILNSNLLSLPIEAKYFIDATGTAEFSKICGCEFLNDISCVQQNSLRFILGNIDIEKFSKFLIELDDDENITNTYRNDVNTNNEIHFTTASTWDENKHWKLDKYLKKAIKDGVLSENDRSYFQIFSIAGGLGQVAFNCPRINNYKNNPFKASNELIEAKKAIWRLYQFSKRYFPGFENAVITNIATITGKREERRVKTKYVFTLDDINTQKSFKIPILKANYAIDIHGADKNSSVLQKVVDYELPKEALMSANFGNLFVVGKILGADFTSHSALRVQKSCMSMAEGIVKHIASLK